MIGDPVNDAECLGPITEIARGLVDDNAPAIRALVDKHKTLTSLIKELRSWPQRDDEGDPCDGPRVDACDPPQRLRIVPMDPNCVERMLIMIAAGQMIDPDAHWQMATTDTKYGPHSFPVRNGKPVVVDPRMTRNALAGGLYRNAPAPVRLTPTEAIHWIAEIAEEPVVRCRGGRELVWRARDAMLGLLDGFVLDLADIHEVALVLALAEREARAFGVAGVSVVQTTAAVLADLDDDALRNRAHRPGWPIGRYRVRPHPITVKVAKVTGRVGARAVAAATRTYLASLGIPPTLLEDLELELRKEGLTLGAFGQRRGDAVEAVAEQAVKQKVA
jgi:hypothetical protein